MTNVTNAVSRTTRHVSLTCTFTGSQLRAGERLQTPTTTTTPGTTVQPLGRHIANELDIGDEKGRLRGLP